MLVCSALPMPAQVLRIADLTTRELARLDFARTVLIVPGSILEEHGPYLPSGTDGIFNEQLTRDLAATIDARPGWTAVIFPTVPLGAGAANEIGRKYSFPGSVTVRPETLRAVFMDFADQLGAQGFRWIMIVNGHGDPAHNRMLDQAGEYFHDTYGGEMVNVFGYVWAMKLEDFRRPEQKRQDGMAEHATMTETSVVMALRPAAVRPGLKAAPSKAGQSMEELERIASAPDWPGYFGAPALASAALGRSIYNQWLARSRDLVLQILAGEDYRKLPRIAELYADDPADAAAATVNRELEAKHEAWLQERAGRK